MVRCLVIDVATTASKVLISAGTGDRTNSGLAIGMCLSLLHALVHALLT